jgi:hypothetical protein
MIASSGCPDRFWALEASYPIGIGRRGFVSRGRVKRRREAYDSPLTSAEVNKMLLYSSTPLGLHCVDTVISVQISTNKNYYQGEGFPSTQRYLSSFYYSLAATCFVARQSSSGNIYRGNQFQ